MILVVGRTKGALGLEKGSEVDFKCRSGQRCTLVSFNDADLQRFIIAKTVAARYSMDWDTVHTISARKFIHWLHQASARGLGRGTFISVLLRYHRRAIREPA